jgi:Flp pilus assembly protein TadD
MRASWSRIRSLARRDPAILLVGLAMLAATAIYAPTLSRSLVNYDDPWLVQDNFILHDASPSSVRTVLFDTSPTTRFVLGSEYLPVRDLSVMADFAVWGSWYPGHHLTNLVLYLLALLVWFRALEAFGVERGLAGLAILLWAIHPTHAESVAWLSERKGLLALLWSGVVALGYARYRGGRRWGWLALALVAVVLAVWSKALSAFAIASLAGLELALPERRRSWHRSLASLAAIAIVGGVAFVPVLRTAIALQVVGGEGHAPAGWLAMVIGLHGFYLELAAMACRNAISYPIHSLGPSGVQLVLGAVGLIVAAAVVAVPARRGWRPPPVLRAAGWIWLLGWFPASRLVLPLKAVLVCDRYALFPTLGVALAAAWVLRRIELQRARRALIVTIVVAASLRAVDAQSNWRDSVTLWQRAVESNPSDGDAWSQLAGALESSGRSAAAAVAVSAGLRHSRAPRLLFREAMLVLEHGQRPVAIQAMREAAEAGGPRAMSNLALLLFEDGKVQDALDWARRAATTAPMYASASRNLGTIALAAKRPQEAYEALRHAYELGPAFAINRYNLATALVALHRYREARAQLETCSRDPEVGARARALLRQLPPPP